MDHILIGIICAAVVLAIKVGLEGRKDFEIVSRKIQMCIDAREECLAKSQEAQDQIQVEQVDIPELKQAVRQLESKQKTLEKRAKFWDEKYDGKPRRKHQKDITEM